MSLDDVIICMNTRLSYCKEEMIWKCLLMICIYVLLVRWNERGKLYIYCINEYNMCKWDM